MYSKEEKDKGTKEAALSSITCSQGRVAERSKILATITFTTPLATNPRKPVKTVDIKPPVEDERPAKVRHLNKTRPHFKHRPPTSIRRQSTPGFFHERPENFLEQLKSAVISAKHDYRLAIEENINPRKKKTLLSNRRHGKAGQIRAEEFCKKIQKADSVEQILNQLIDFFNNCVTYDYNSFSSYLLDKFNRILKDASLPECERDASDHFDCEAWTYIKGQLESLIPGNEKASTNDLNLENYRA